MNSTQIHKQFPIKDRSVLYCLSPIASQTPYIESLSSYIMRLAKAHCVPVGVFVRKMLAPQFDDPQTKGEKGRNRFSEGGKGVNGIQKGAMDCVHALELLTKQLGLSDLTMLKWNGLITTRHLFSNHLSWCPLCFEEWRFDEGTVYVPLLWHLKPCTVCMKHKIHLFDHCPGCDQPVPVLYRHSMAGYCPHCYTWLAKGIENRKVNDEDINWHRWVTDNLGNLLSERPNNFSSSETSYLQKNIQSMVNQLTQGNVAGLGRLLGVAKNTIWTWIRGDTLPSLDQLLRISFLGNIRLRDLLLAESIQTAGIQRPPIVNSSSITRRKLNHENIHLRLKQYLSQSQAVPMNQIASELGIEKRVLFQNHSQLCKSLSLRFREELNSRSKRRKKRLSEQIEEVVRDLTKQSIYPSSRRVEVALSSPGILREQTLKQAFKKARDDIWKR